jgi:hypothetical protein
LQTANRTGILFCLGALVVLMTACVELVDQPTEMSEQALSGDGVSTNLEIPLVVVLWEHINYGGVKRQFIRDEPHLGPGVAQQWNCWTPPYGGAPICGWSADCFSGPGINDWASAVGVHPGPSYQSFINSRGFEPTVTLFEHDNFTGSSITLHAGAYANLGTFGFNDRASSLRFNEFPANWLLPTSAAATIGWIRNVVRLHKHTNTNCMGGNPDHVITIAESSPSIGAQYGSDWNDETSAIEWLRGPNYDGAQPKLSEHEGYSGAYIGAGTWIWLGYNDIAGYFNDKISSLQIP